jgi:hypothetical protein
MSHFKRTFSHLSFIFVAVFISLSTATVRANCPFGNCNGLACLAICVYCGDEELVGSCWDPYSHCWMMIGRFYVKDYNGEPGTPCYICGSVDSSAPIWCEP